MKLEEIQKEAQGFPLAYREKVIRQAKQIEEGQRHGVRVVEALKSLAGEVDRIKKQLGLDKAISEVHPMHLVRFNSPWGEGCVDEARQMVSVGGVEFSEREVDILVGKGLDNKTMGFVINAKRELEGKVMR